MTTKIRIFAGVSLGVLASGCSVADKELVGYQDPGFGEANRATYAAMVINPDPQYEDPIPPTSAEHAAQAIERYRTDQVKQPESIRATSGVQGSGGGGGS